MPSENNGKFISSLFDGHIFAKWFGVNNPDLVRTMGWWTKGIFAAFGLLAFWHLSTEGCFFGSQCGFADLSGSSFIELFIAIIAIGWSIGIAIGQREQLRFLENQAPARQHFDSNFLVQMQALASHFGEIKDVGNSENFDLNIFVSSPAFGILNGPSGVKVFRRIVEQFAEAAVARAARGKQSELYLYFWNEADHLELFKSDAICPQTFWAKPNELSAIKSEINLICKSLTSIHLANDPDTNNKKMNGLISVFLFEISQQVESRFFLLDSERNQKAAMISMIPLAGTVGDDQYSVLLTNSSSEGYEKIAAFFHGCTSGVGSSLADTKAANTAGDELCAAPEKFYKKYFGSDIL